MNNPEMREGDSPALWAIYTSTVVFLATTWFMVFDSGAKSPFFFHPLLQSLGIAVFVYGITTLQPATHPKSKAAGLDRHQRAMISGAVLIMLGSTAVVYSKASRNAPHFTTWHGTFGVMSGIWMFVQLLFGGASVWFDGNLLGGKDKARMFWKYHRLSGYVLFPMLLFTAQVGGIWSKWAVGNSSPMIRFIAYIIAPVVLLGAVYSRIRTSKVF